MIPVILESPYAGQVGRNKLYLQACIRDCITRGESPYASHQLLTDALNDGDPIERQLGIDAAQPWYKAAFMQVVYIDFGISSGMKYGIDRFMSQYPGAITQRMVEYRKLGGVWAFWAGLVAK